MKFQVLSNFAADYLDNIYDKFNNEHFMKAQKFRSTGNASNKELIKTIYFKEALEFKIFNSSFKKTISSVFFLLTTYFLSFSQQHPFHKFHQIIMIVPMAYQDIL